MIPVWRSVEGEGWCSVREAVEDSVSSSVWDSVFYTVFHSVNGSVNFPVWDSVCVSVDDLVRSENETS